MAGTDFRVEMSKNLVEAFLLVKIRKVDVVLFIEDSIFDSERKKRLAEVNRSRPHKIHGL